MSTVTSKDNTKIAFDKVGSGPAVILVCGAMSFRAFDPTMGALANELSKHFTVYNYDRRGRGESTDETDAKTFTKEHEIEDIKALVEDAGGEAMLFGVSSGGALALEAAAAIPGITKVAVYEVPFVVDDSRKPVKDYEGRARKLVSEGKLDELMGGLMPEAFGMLEDAPAEEGQDQESSAQTQDQAQDQNQDQQGGGDMDPAMMESMYAVLPTIPYDASFVGKFMEGKPLSSDYWAKVDVPAFVSYGSASAAWLQNAAKALSKVLPDAELEVFKDQTHMFDPKVLAPGLNNFFKK